MSGVASPTLSVLDLVPVRTDQTTSDALAATRSLARVADDLGFRRYWLAEHHNVPSVAATSPPCSSRWSRRPPSASGSAPAG